MKLLTLIVALGLWASSAIAQPTITKVVAPRTNYVQVDWDPCPSSNIVAHALYRGPSSVTNFWRTNQVDFTNWVTKQMLGNVTNAFSSNMLNNQRYYFVVTAINADGLESDWSNEININFPVTREVWTLVVGAIVKRARTTNDPFTTIAIRPVYTEPYTNQPMGVYQLIPTVNLQKTVYTNQ